MAAYRRVYDSRHLQADCQEPGSAPEPYARQSSMGYLYHFLPLLFTDYYYYFTIWSRRMTKIKATAKYYKIRLFFCV